MNSVDSGICVLRVSEPGYLKSSSRGILPFSSTLDTAKY